jgi:hypothetical protein
MEREKVFWFAGIIRRRYFPKGCCTHVGRGHSTTFDSLELSVDTFVDIDFHMQIFYSKSRVVPKCERQTLRPVKHGTSILLETPGLRNIPQWLIKGKKPPQAAAQSSRKITVCLDIRHHAEQTVRLNRAWLLVFQWLQNLKRLKATLSMEIQGDSNDLREGVSLF